MKVGRWSKKSKIMSTWLLNDTLTRFYSDLEKTVYTLHYLQTIIDVHYSLWIQFSNKGIVFFMLMAGPPLEQPVNIGVDIRKVSQYVRH